MIVNMAKKPFSVLQLAYVYPSLPIIACLLNIDSTLQLMITRGGCILALLNFFSDVYVVSVQFMAHTGRTFFIRQMTA